MRWLLAVVLTVGCVDSTGPTHALESRADPCYPWVTEVVLHERAELLDPSEWPASWEQDGVPLDDQIGRMVHVVDTTVVYIWVPIC